ncbi:MAG: hypothetical protein ACPGKS_01470 [Coraliomargarita sp.]
MFENETMPVDYPALVLDASAGSVFVGVLSAEHTWLAHRSSNANALEGLFSTVEACLRETGFGIEAIASFVYNGGPGSVLGLRLCAMAIETWRRLSSRPTKLYRFNTLELCAALVRIDHPEIEEALLISDWKKGVWHGLPIGIGKAPEVRPIDQSALNELPQPLFHLPQRKGWQAAPENAIELSYQAERLIEASSKTNLLTETESVALFSAGSSTFQKWTAERHRLAK